METYRSIGTVVRDSIASCLESRYGDRNPRRHLESLARAALVVIAGEAMKRNDLEAAELERAWDGLGRDGGPNFALEGAVEWRPNDDAEGMALVSLREVRSGGVWPAAFGLVLEEGAWRVSWAAICQGEPRPFGLQKTLALSELASLDALATFGPFTSLLEVSWARLALLPAAPLLFLPEARFACQGTGACCTFGFSIPLEPHAAQFLTETSWTDLEPSVGPGPYVVEVEAGEGENHWIGPMLAAREDGRCHLLRPDNRCAVHALLGRAVFTPCHVFPYQFAWSPDGFCVTLHHFCPSVQAQQGPTLMDRSQEGDIRSRLAASGALHPERFLLTTQQEVSWEEFRSVEDRLLEHLAMEAPIRERLWYALCWLDAYLEGEIGLDDPNTPVELPIPAVDEAFASTLEAIVAPFDVYFEAFRFADSGSTTVARNESALGRWFRSLLFGKTLTYSRGLAGGLNDLALIWRILERQTDRWAPDGAPDAFWRSLFALVSPRRGAFQVRMAALHGDRESPWGQQGDSPLLGMNLLRRRAT